MQTLQEPNSHRHFRSAVKNAAPNSHDQTRFATPAVKIGCAKPGIHYNQILSTLLGRAKTPAEAQTSLKVYDQVRRPPTRRIDEASRDTGLIAAGLGETKRLNLADLRAKLQPRWDSIIDSDNEKHRDEALELLVRELKS
ncbi:hypothetical protein ETB97_003331 [Aspergillus alliaceus]|uniref:Uncharacterized protein n=1 Tax=Petromyces alliaceus TaxID=209559 RepID=A0A8H6A182_PETAA|nr:hypothetical protein ETB97_003331 [Aspergillus burnettii]